MRSSFCQASYTSPCPGSILPLHPSSLSAGHGCAFWDQVRIEGKDKVEIHLPPLLAAFSISSTVVLGELSWSSITSARGMCPSLCWVSVEVPSWMCQTAQPCPQLWGGGEGWSCQHSMGPAPSSVSLSSLRVLRVGFGFQAENRCVFNHRWKEYTKLPSPERPLPASRLVCSCWDNRV